LNYYERHIGEPHQSRLLNAMQDRDNAKLPREKSRVNARIRSIRMEAAREKGTHTLKQWNGLIRAFGGRCVMCGIFGTSVVLQKDHIVPVYQGGSDGIENLQPLCLPCNTSKGPDATNWVEYRMANGFGE
jgi:5-methylcytosine-specific restriction endonuclease McrA